MLRILDHDHRGGRLQVPEGAPGKLRVLGIHDQRPGPAVPEDEGDLAVLQAGVQGVQHGAGHRDAVVALEHLGDVGQEDGDGVAAPDPGTQKPVGQLAAPVPEGPPRHPLPPVDHGNALGPHAGRALEEADRTEGRVVGVDPTQAGGGRRRHRMVLSGMVAGGQA